MANEVGLRLCTLCCQKDEDILCRGVLSFTLSRLHHRNRLIEYVHFLLEQIIRVTWFAIRVSRGLIQPYLEEARLTFLRSIRYSQ